tara:strand:- start:9361 stop:9618 length:258 start_codon:yes stop_codon:yes gene_type:complete
MTQWTRLQELEDFRLTLAKLKLFLDGKGPSEVINIIDPEQIMQKKLIGGVNDSIAWVVSEIAIEDENEDAALPSEGRRTGALAGQ